MYVLVSSVRLSRVDSDGENLEVGLDSNPQDLFHI